MVKGHVAGFVMAVGDEVEQIYVARVSCAGLSGRP